MSPLFSTLKQLFKDTKITISNVFNKLKQREVFNHLLIASVVFAAFLPLIYFGGFHNFDDFHFLRTYSKSELIQSWYSNWNFTGMEANGYRPLAVFTNHILYSLFGFNDVPFMMIIVIVNILYALTSYHLARNFLSKSFSMTASLIAVLLPQTLFHSTCRQKYMQKLPLYCLLLALIQS